MTLQENRFPRIFTLCALYVAQGIPWGFVAITLVAWLADRGLQSSDVAQITVLSTLPWSFKWIWGPVIDRYGFAPMGRRRPWIGPRTEPSSSIASWPTPSRSTSTPSGTVGARWSAG